MNYTVHTPDTAPQAAKETLDQVARAYGFLPNLIGLMAEAPALAKSYFHLAGLFEETSFSPTERQIVLLTTSYENACDYCVAAHTVIADMQKVPQPVVEAIRNGTPIADPKLELLRRFTAEVVTSRGRPSDELSHAFLAAGFSRAQILEVILGVGLKTISNYTNHIARTPVDRAFSGAVWSKAA